MYNEIIKDTVGQIVKNKSHSFLTMFSVTIAVFCILMIVSGSEYTQNNLKKQLGNQAPLSFMYTANDLNLRSGFTTQDQALIQDQYGVKQVKLVSNGLSNQVTISYDGQIYNETIRSKEQASINVLPLTVAGKPLSSIGEYQRGQVWISDDLANQLESNVKTTFNALLGTVLLINNYYYTIQGIYYVSSDSNVLPDMIVTNADMNSIFSGQTIYDELDVSMSRATTNQDMTDLLQLLNTKGQDRLDGRYTAINNEKALAESAQTVSTLTNVLTGIGLIALFVAGFGVMNAMYSSVTERYQEIGIRRAIGASSGMIQFSYLLEGSLLTIFGALSGIIAALITILIGNLLGIAMGLSIISIIITFICSILIGMIFSYLPALNASVQNVVEVIK